MDPGLSGKDPSKHPKAPGMKYRHYAPKASMAVYQGDREKVIKKDLPGSGWISGG